MTHHDISGERNQEVFGGWNGVWRMPEEMFSVRGIIFIFRSENDLFDSTFETGSGG